MENRTHTDQPQRRHLSFSDPLARRRQDDETDDDVSRMENEGGPPPVVRHVVRHENTGSRGGSLGSLERGRLRVARRART